GWEYSGCYFDAIYYRVLPVDFYHHTASYNVTAEICTKFCASWNYNFAGLKSGERCYCGNSLLEQSGTTGCSLPCSGDESQVCGGSDRLTVYTNLVTFSGGSDWTSLGCFYDKKKARTLSKLVLASSVMTPEICLRICAGYGAGFAGVEYGVECFCGSDILNNATRAAVGGCAMPCKGNSSELCGGQDRINLY
ncbi:WSC-domain-containing protein, partial [Byssothecium circinans]